MSYTRQDVIVSRDCPAVTVPYGSPVTIEKGCEATITQQLGGSFVHRVRRFAIDGQVATPIVLVAETVDLIECTAGRRQ